MNKPLTILGAERKLFFLALTLGTAAFNLFDTLLGAITMFLCFQLLGIWATASDPQLLRILLNSRTVAPHYSPFKFKPVTIRVIRRHFHV